MAYYESLSHQETVTALAQLLTPPAQEQEGALATCSAASRGPGGIGPGGLLPGVTVPPPRGRGSAAGAARSSNAQAIWDEEEVAQAALDTDDGRETPRYEFIYKQAVGTADTFLGLSGKHPSSTCCESLVLRIELPNTRSAAELDLDLKPDQVHLRSPHYKLLLPLPHKVDDAKSSAKWDPAKQTLVLTLAVVRSLDDLL